MLCDLFILGFGMYIGHRFSNHNRAQNTVNKVSAVIKSIKDLIRD